jgi:anti-sigma regulatory factor (Ser/Thr protein kinase)
MLLERLPAAGGSLADESDQVLELALPPVSASAGAARRALGEYCTKHEAPADLREFGELVISELVTNAVVHARTPFLVWAEYDAGELTIAVADGASAVPRLLPFDDGLRQGGRGMAVVDELGGRWGLVKTDLGKIVWVTIPGQAEVPAQRPETEVP